jgi:hypothetical protein
LPPSVSTWITNSNDAKVAVNQVSYKVALAVKILDIPLSFSNLILSGNFCGPAHNFSFPEKEKPATRFS